MRLNIKITKGLETLVDVSVESEVIPQKYLDLVSIVHKCNMEVDRLD